MYNKKIIKYVDIQYEATLLSKHLLSTQVPETQSQAAQDLDSLSFLNVSLNESGWENLSTILSQTMSQTPSQRREIYVIQK